MNSQNEQKRWESFSLTYTWRLVLCGMCSNGLHLRYLTTIALFVFIKVSLSLPVHDTEVDTVE